MTLINKVDSIQFLILGYTSSEIILIWSVKRLDIQVLEAILRALKTFILTVTVASFWAIVISYLVVFFWYKIREDLIAFPSLFIFRFFRFV